MLRPLTAWHERISTLPRACVQRRHTGCATPMRALVVDRQVPMPAAQALLGHASVQTTAAYSKTDLSQLRAFVEATFPSAKRVVDDSQK